MDTSQILPKSQCSSESASCAAEESSDNQSDEDVFTSIVKELQHLENYTTASLQKKWTNNNQCELNKFTSNLKTLFNSCLLSVHKKESELSQVQRKLLEKQEIIINLQKEDLIPKVQANANTALRNMYASTVKKGLSGQSDIFVQSTDGNTVNKQNHLLILETEISGRERLSNDEFKEKKKEIMNVLQPGKIGIGVKSTGTTKKGGIVMSFDSDRERLLAKDVLDKNVKELNLKAKIPNKILPKMSLIKVGDKVSNKDELKDGIIKQNPFISERMSEGDIFEVLFITKQGDAILKMSPTLRKIIKSKGRLFLELESFRCVDRIYVKQCYKCNEYGHTESITVNGKVVVTCPSKDPICAHCSGPHRFKDCEHRNDSAKMKCTNCHQSKLFQSECHHRSSDSNCPSFQQQRLKVINNTDFGKDGY